VSNDYPEELREAARSLLIIARKYPEQWRAICSGVTADNIETLREIAGETDAPEESPN
jgi:hypothetical protein